MSEFGVGTGLQHSLQSTVFRSTSNFLYPKCDRMTEVPPLFGIRSSSSCCSDFTTLNNTGDINDVNNSGQYLLIEIFLSSHDICRHFAQP